MSLTSRRIIAKLIDFVAFGGFVALGVRLGGSPGWGLALGAAYLLVGDAFGSNAKSWLGLRVVDARTHAKCTFQQSVLRNLPWLWAPAVRAVSISMEESAADTSSVLRAVGSFVGLVVTASLYAGLKKGAHWADAIAGTKVLGPDGPPSTSAGSSARATTTAAPVVRTHPKPAPPRADDRDAPDFDDAPGARNATPKASNERERDAPDFDDKD